MKQSLQAFIAAISMIAIGAIGVLLIEHVGLYLH